MDTIRAFLTKSGHFYLIFKIVQGRSPTSPPPSCAPDQTMKFRQFLKYNTINIFLEKQFGKCDGESSTRSFSKKSKSSKSLLNFAHSTFIT